MGHGHPVVEVPMVRQFVAEGRRADMMPALKHINDNPGVERQPLREWIMDQVEEAIRTNPSADGVLLSPPGTDTRFQIIFE